MLDRFLVVSVGIQKSLSALHQRGPCLSTQSFDLGDQRNMRSGLSNAEVDLVEHVFVRPVVDETGGIHDVSEGLA